MLKLSLVTPSKKLLTDLVVEDLFVPAYRGELDILAGHAPLMSTLGTGVLRYKTQGSGSYEKVAISWGYLEVLHDRVTVLAETAETAGEIDLNRAREAKANAEKELLRADLEQHEFEKYQLKLNRSIVRIGLGGNDDMGAAAERTLKH